MGLETWLSEVQERQRVALAGLGLFQQQVEGGMQQLRASLEEARQRVDEREPGRARRAAESVDEDALLSKLKKADFASLSRRERRAVPWFWRKVGPDLMAAFLGHFPESWPRLVKQLLREWKPTDGGAEHQDAWGKLAGKCPTDERSFRWRLPVPIETALGSGGPAAVAKAWERRPLREVVGGLGSAGVRPGVGYAGYVVAESLLRRCRTRGDVTEDLLFLLESPEGRGWLPSTGTERVGIITPVPVRVAVIAAVLECRVTGQMEPMVRTRIEERLVSKDSVFGDPRLTTLTEAWSAVRSRAKAAFEDFLSALIQQDLEFFFEHAMHERDRHAFWLRYLDSIRLTVCWLDPDTYDGLCGKVETFPVEQQAALRRAKRFSRKGVSAFCLRFEQYSVVEFSRTGNATYVYRNSDFDRMVSRNRFEMADDIKERNLAKARLSHMDGWQVRFEQALLDLGIERPPSGKKPRR